MATISPVMPTYARAPVAFERGEGVWLYAEDGAAYLDFTSGIAVTALGHAHPRLVAALQGQAERLWHTSNLFRVAGQERLAERLIAHSFADTVFFTNSGLEAIECCVKAARRHHWTEGRPERTRILCMEGAFHGRSLAAIAASGQQKLVEGCGPMPDGFDHAPFDDLDAVAARITPETAAVMLEPIQGEGGVRPIPSETLRAVRALCDEAGALLILDEIQCGIGRTGRLFAHEWAGIEPDLLATAKGLGGGFPLGACLASARAASGMTPGSHGSTYGGNPLAMAVGDAVLETVLEDGFLDHVRRVSGHLRQRLEGLVAANPEVFESVRGEGLMLGVKCRAPNAEMVQSARARRLLLVAAGDNVVRVLPPLIVAEGEIDEAVERLGAAAADLEASRHARTAAKTA